MPENVAPRSGAPAAGSGGRGKGAYQDRDKPAQIRFSNISAAKGIAPSPAGPRAGVKVVPCPGAPLCKHSGTRAWLPGTHPVVGRSAPLAPSQACAVFATLVWTTVV